MTKLFTLTLLLASASFAAITNLAVTGTTATQAVISYTAPDTNPCTFSVVEGSGAGGPLVNDVNPNIFASSSSDNRPGSLGQGTVYRVVVVGSRTAAFASAGEYSKIRHYSRALQANTTYQFSVQCGADVADITFSTTNIPLGNTFAEPWLVDGFHPGDQPFPEALADGTGGNFIDPLTGMYLQEVSTRGEVADAFLYPPNNPIISAHNAGHAACDTAGPWQSPCDAIAPQGWNNCPAPQQPCSFGSGYASVGNSTKWLVLPVDMDQQSYGGLWGGTDYTWGNSLDQMSFGLTGYATSDNNQLDVCLSLNSGASCASQILPLTLPVGQGSAAVVSVGQADPTKFGIIPWLMDSTPRISRPEWERHTGQVSVSGNSLTWVSGDPFSIYWFVNGTGSIWLTPTSDSNGQQDVCSFSAFKPNSHAREYYLVTMTDGNHVVISSPPPAGSYWYCTHNAAVMVRRHTADSNNVYIQGAYLQAIDHNGLSTSGAPMPYDGETTACWNTLYQGGWLCNFGGMLWVNPVTGATSWFGEPNLGAKTAGADQWSGGMCSSAGSWDQTQSRPTWYCLVQDKAKKWAIIQAVYNGSVSPPAEPQQGQAGGQINGYSQDATCAGAFGDYCVSFGGGALVFTDITPSSLGQDLQGQLQKFTKGFHSALFPNCPGSIGMTVQMGVIVTGCQSQGQDTPGWLVAISPGDADPQHAGTTGAHIIGATNSYGGPVLRWRGVHSVNDYGEQPWFGFSTNSYGTMIITTNTVIGVGGTDCSTFGGTSGKTCITVQINAVSGSYEPYLQKPTAPFKGTPGELGPSMPGDTAAFCASNGEIMTLVKKNYKAAGLQVWQRGENQVSCNGGTETIYFQPSATGWVIWNPSTDPHGRAFLVDNEDTGGHGYWRDGGSAESADLGSMVCDNPLFNAYQTRLGSYAGLATAPMTYVSGNPNFAGACFGIALPNDVQSHPNAPGALASQTDPQGFDIRPMLGASLALPFSPLNGQLFVSTWPTVLDPDNFQSATSSAQLNRKLVSTAASCGSHPLVDISGPGSVINGTALHSYNYCVPRAAGECYKGSHVGQVYVNCPDVVEPDCNDNTGYLATQNCNSVSGGCVMGMGNDICVFNASAPAQSLVQFALGQNEPSGMPGGLGRNLTTSIGRIRMTSGFSNARALPDNSWILFKADWLNRNEHDIWMGKLGQSLPWPAIDYNRSTFIPLMVAADPPNMPSTITNAVVQFGYAENGGNTDMYCTTRRETCVSTATSASPFPNPPFTYAGEAAPGVPCAYPAACTIYIPAISQRVVYYQVLFRDSANNIVAETPVEAAAVP